MAGDIPPSDDVQELWPPRRPEPSRAKSSDQSRTHLIDPPNRLRPYNGLQSQLWTLCQALKLKVVYTIASKISGKTLEESKVAVYKHRGHAGLRCAIHIVPVTAAFVLIILNCKQYYIGGELEGNKGQDTEKLAALQFVAKLHELFMLASLGTIMFTYIRRELLFGSGIPFGALFIGFQIDSISLLWSPEFIGTIFHEWKAKSSRKIYLISMIVICTFLGVAVGPSSANLMKPRLGYWPAGGTSFWINGTKDSMYPKLISDSASLAHCSFDTGDAACPHGDWRLIEQEYHAFWPRLRPMGSMPLHIDIPSPFAMRAMTIYQRSTSEDWNDQIGSIWGSKYSLATVPTAPVADGLAEVAKLWARAMAVTRQAGFQFRKDVKFKSKAPQATVYTRCLEKTFDTGNPDGLELLQLRFPVLSAIKLPDGHVIDGTVHQEGYEVNDDPAIHDRVNEVLMPETPPALIWIDDGDMLNKTNSTLLAIATIPDAASDSSNVYCCSIDSRLTEAEIFTTRNGYKLVSGIPSNWANGTVDTPLPKIMISADWAKYMNPIISEEKNATAFSKTSSTAGMWNTSLTSASDNFPIIIEGILTAMVANGIARASYNTTMISTLKGDNGDSDNQWKATGWYSYLFPHHLFGKGSSIFNISAEQQANSTEFKMSAAAQGYAYSYKGKTQKAAIGVLVFYILLAVLHLGYSLRTGWASTSWDSLPEIAALAMNSRPTQTLHNTGAGIETVGVFEENVRVRARDGHHLELVFDDTGDGGFYVRRNKKYG